MQTQSSTIPGIHEGHFTLMKLTISGSLFSARAFAVRSVLLVSGFCCFIHIHSFSQAIDSVKRELIIDFEARPRAEYRDNFKLTAADSIMPELFATQRNRLNITYLSRNFKFHASPQEIHVWGKSDRFSRVGSINAFELYIEPSFTNHFSARIGRQALSLDNGRIYSAAPWGQQGRSHEGVRFFYNKKVTTDLTIAFTRNYGNAFNAAYSPVAAHQYKLLFVHHLKYTFKNHLAITTINTLEVFDKNDKNRHDYHRITNGGRLEYSHGWIYGTVNAYYQYGRNASAKTIRAYYIQPEISATTNKATLRLGAEIMSGDRKTVPANVTNSFVPLYGVAWKFMGNMNLFTRFPADLNDRGLVNPYLFFLYQVNKKLALRSDFHLFYAQHQLSESKELAGTYLGFENDISINYKPVKRLEIIFGVSSTFAGERMELLKKVPDSDKVPVWSYLMVSYTPRLLHLTARR
ncbi:alginate export family protein [Dyadobacter sp. CY107]|uniref:alginate export family protein n=1 Tax=Dyadobacter fanqingshengii TaxID=2906443 RepID=UPI001F200DF2|nr:alginate export family protein [Dyadobacter fanqingshengii]MCF2501910.1 alginate export family protein [Dyadobacter fanqingshengii]